MYPLDDQCSSTATAASSLRTCIILKNRKHEKQSARRQHPHLCHQPTSPNSAYKNWRGEQHVGGRTKAGQVQKHLWLPDAGKKQKVYCIYCGYRLLSAARGVIIKRTVLYVLLTKILTTAVGPRQHKTKQTSYERRMSYVLWQCPCLNKGKMIVPLRSGVPPPTKYS